MPSSTVKVVDMVSNMVAPLPLEGSQYPERLAYTDDFTNAQIVTERLAGMLPQQQIASGYSLPSMLLQCTYAGVQCDERLVNSV